MEKWFAVAIGFCEGVFKLLLSAFFLGGIGREIGDGDSPSPLHCQMMGREGKVMRHTQVEGGSRKAEDMIKATCRDFFPSPRTVLNPLKTRKTKHE